MWRPFTNQIWNGRLSPTSKDFSWNWVQDSPLWPAKSISALRNRTAISTWSFIPAAWKFYLLIDLKVGELEHVYVGQIDGYVRLFCHFSAFVRVAAQGAPASVTLPPVGHAFAHSRLRYAGFPCFASAGFRKLNIRLRAPALRQLFSILAFSYQRNAPVAEDVSLWTNRNSHDHPVQTLTISATSETHP